MELIYCAQSVLGVGGLSPLHLGNRASFEKMPQEWRAVGNILFDLTGPRFEPQTSHSKDKHVTAQPTGQLINVK